MRRSVFNPHHQSILLLLLLRLLVQQPSHCSHSRSLLSQTRVPIWVDAAITGIFAGLAIMIIRKILFENPKEKYNIH